MRRLISFGSLFVMLTLLVALGAAPAQAHEFRKIGAFNFVVGWGDEPPYAGFKNSVQLFLHDAKTDKPIVDLGDTLSVEVKFGTDTKKLTFEPDFEIGEFGEPGDYRAWIIPTRAGQYSFHLTGTVHGQKIDATFTSGEKTFDDIKEQTDAQFPAQDPSNAALSDRIDRGLARTDTAVLAAKKKASSAAVPGWIGLGLGVVALVVAIAGLGGRKKTA
jgi:hypothetical protein